MVQMAALGVLVLAGGWLIVIGLVMALRPLLALHILSLTATSHKANLIEQLPRLVAGGAMMVRAEQSLAPQLFAVGGGFVALSSIALIVIPLAWHNGYAKWWAQRIPPIAVRAIAPFSIGGGAALIYAAW